MMHGPINIRNTQIFYYENEDNNFPSTRFLFRTHSFNVCYSLGASDMAIYDIDTKFIFDCVSDLQRIEDDRNRKVISERK